MQLIIQYLSLVFKLVPDRGAEQDVIPLTVGEIANILNCSERNVKILLKKMADNGWIEWMPGRGRGHRSNIRFLLSGEELLMREAGTFVKAGNLKSAMELLQLPEVSSAIRERFMSWLGTYFGYKNGEAGHPGEETLRLPLRPPYVHTLDPADLFFARDLHFVNQVFDTLVRFDPSSQRIVPHLAHDWECSGDGKRWTFHLRKGVVFHHGGTMTPEDVRFSFERLIKRGREATNYWLVEHIQEIRCAGRHTLIVILDKPNYMFAHYLSSSAMSILPREIYQNKTDADRFPIGTGPFQLIRHDKGSLVLKAFDSYFRERAHLDRIEILNIPPEIRENRLNFSLFHFGNRHQARFAFPKDWKTVKRQILGTSLLVFNLQKKGPQQDIRFRRAIQLLLDRRQMIADLGLEEGRVSTGFLPREDHTEAQSFCDPEAAVTLLRASGYGGETLTLLTMPGHHQLSQWIRRQCAKLGVRMRIRLMNDRRAMDPGCLMAGDLHVGGVVAEDDVARCLLEMYKVRDFPIRRYAGDERRRQFDERIAEILAEPQKEIRSGKIQELETLLTAGHYVLFLIHHTGRTAYTPEIRGVSINTLGWSNFAEIWFPEHLEA